MDAQDWLDIAGERRVEADWDLYKRAVRWGMRNIPNPPRWLAKNLRRDKGLAALADARAALPLTEKEREALDGVALGKETQAAYGRKVGRHRRTICGHLKSAERKVRDAGIAHGEAEEFRVEED